MHYTDSIMDGVDWDAPGSKEKLNTSTLTLLVPALRQFQHNDGSGLLAGYDRNETERIVAGLAARIQQLEAELKRKDELLREIGALCVATLEDSWPTASRVNQIADKARGALK